jgi:hypothetical protein
MPENGIARKIAPKILWLGVVMLTGMFEQRLSFHQFSSVN